MNLNLRWSHIPSSFLAAVVVLAIAGTAVPAQAQTPTVIFDFSGSGNPQNPNAWAIAQGRDGNLYASADSTVSTGVSALFKITPTGTLSVVADLQDSYGATLGTDGNFYSATQLSGTDNIGQILKVTPGGVVTVLHSFTGTTDGSHPVGPPIQAANGIFYGVTSAIGGGNSTAYSVTSAGVFTTIHTFTGSDGQNAYGPLVQGTDGNLYGATITGGSSNDGVIFKITSGGVYKVLYNFPGPATANLPGSGLIQATDGKLYGTTSFTSGPFHWGSVYSFSTSGTFTNLYSFTGSTDGGQPTTPLFQHTNGLIYGGVYVGGGVGVCGSIEWDGENVDVNGCGAIFSLNIGAKQFVSLVSASGRVGSKIGILGQGFSASSVVKFNGVAATAVTRTGSTFLLATVPTGASDGKVTVTTGTTTLTSSKKFIVHDSWSSGAAMPVAVYGPATAALNGDIYVVGGYSTETIADTQIYNPAANTWSTSVSLPTATDTAASAVVGNVLYVIGGSSSLTGTRTNAVWAYNPATKTWSGKAAMPTARNGARAVVENNIIYVMGGYNGTTFIDTVESYNPATNTWKEEAPMLGTKDTPAAGVIGTMIVVAGGSNAPGSVTGDTEAYNATTNAWSSLSADPTARTGQCAGVINGLLYDASGYINNGGAATTVNESFSLSANKWTATLTPMPAGTMFGGSAVFNGQLYCLGGESSINANPVSSVQIYQP